MGPIVYDGLPKLEPIIYEAARVGALPLSSEHLFNLNSLSVMGTFSKDLLLRLLLGIAVDFNCKDLAKPI